jgi:hypothetical protein
MEQREKLNRAREKQGIPPVKMHASWVARPKMNPALWAIFHDFTDFASLCGGEPTPQALQAWLDMTEVDTEDRPWMIKVYTRLSSVIREPAQQGEQ